MYIRSRTTYVPVFQHKEQALECPICKSIGGIHITVYQKHVETGYSKKITNQLTGSIYCRTCNRDIPPVSWSRSLEYAFLELKKNAPRQKREIKFTRRFKIFLFSVLTLIGFLTATIFWKKNQAKREATEKAEIIASPQIGDKWEVRYRLKNGYGSWPRTILKVVKIDGNKIYVQHHKNFQKEDVGQVSSDDKDFTGEIFLVLKKDKELESEDKNFTATIEQVKR